MSAQDCDVAVIGAGVTGTALLYDLAKYTDVGRIAIFDKYPQVAQVSSRSTNNSQTLHFGDIETNYSVEKAAQVKVAAGMVVRYLEKTPGAEDAFLKRQKMVLAVGEKEVGELEARHASFRRLFPGLRKVDRAGLAECEPAVVEGRPSSVPILALMSDDGYIVNFEKLSQSFLDEALKAKPGGIDVWLGTAVDRVEKSEGGYLVRTSGGDVRAAAVVVAAGAYSLLMAQSLGCGLEYSMIPVVGNFYLAPNRLRGKVYTVQEKRLPFAALHADPDINDAAVMRFGPVSKAMPILEPRNWKTAFDFMKLLRPDFDLLRSVIAINTDPVLGCFILESLLHEVPFVGRRRFVAAARKIIPTIKAEELRFGRGIGGIRPQVVNKKERKLQMGEAKIVADGIIFNITPSPGATVCLKNAEEDMRTLMRFFGGRFRVDEAAFAADFG
ncbi:FAD-dependent oxidoreductase [Candidatus Uhrbacteria bacterium]|nr:FAD-dependent oxidoreductase [Candidatus Uhrbacteria bacterium]